MQMQRSVRSIMILKCLFLVALIVLTQSLPLRVKRLIQPRSISEFFKAKLPKTSSPPKLEGIPIDWPLDDKTRMVDFDSKFSRTFLEDNPKAVYLKGMKNAGEIGSDGFPVLPNMESSTWKEILDPALYERLVREMRCPVPAFDERRYYSLMKELDLYRTQNYWETTRPHFEKKLKACRTEAEREALQEKIREFNLLSYQRVIYYQNLPRRSLEKDFSKYYDQRVKGWKELRRIPPFAIPQYAVEQYIDRFGEETNDEEDDDETSDSDYFLNDNEFSFTAEEEGFGQEAYLPCLNEGDLDKDDLLEERRAAETAENTETVIQELSQRSFLYRLVPEKYRIYYDFLLFLKKRPSKSDLTSSLGVGAGIFAVCLMQAQSNRALYYTTLGHLSLLSLLLNRGKPVKKLNEYQQMMERFRPQATWSANTLRTGSLLTGGLAVSFTSLFFLALTAVPGISWALKLRLAYATSLLPTAWISTRFAIYEDKAQNGQLFKSFLDRIQSARDRQVNRRQSLDRDAVTLKLDQSFEDFRSKDRLPIYQEYRYPLDPEEIDNPSMKYVDEYEDEMKRQLGRDYEPRLHYTEALSEEKTRRIAIQQEKQPRNLGAEVSQYKDNVQRFFQERAKKTLRPRLTSDLPTETIEAALGVAPGFLNTEEDFPDWIVNLQDRNKRTLQKKIDRTLSRKFKRQMRSLKRLKQPEEGEEGDVRTITTPTGDKQQVYLGEFGFREQRPQWLIDLFGKDPEDQNQQIESDYLSQFAQKFGFYRLTNHKRKPDVKLEKSDLQ